MAFTHKLTYTQTVGTPGGNLPTQVTVDVENLDVAAALIVGIVKAAALDSNVEVSGANVVSVV